MVGLPPTLSFVILALSKGLAESPEEVYLISFRDGHGYLITSLEGTDMALHYPFIAAGGFRKVVEVVWCCPVLIFHFHLAETSVEMESPIVSR